MRHSVRITIACLAVLAAACSSGSATAPTTTNAAVSAAVRDGADPARVDASGTEWLCRPGVSPDPCVTDLAAAVQAPDGSISRQAAPPADQRVDCFYVYPTVSTQHAGAANLSVDPTETAVARIQASRFSSVCRVYAPMYPQLTLSAIAGNPRPTAAQETAAQSAVVSAWQDYLAHFNHGRGVILIGHSQGSAVLEQLIRSTVDHDPSVRSKLVSAILLGGNVTVPVGGTVGGTFDSVPACTSASQTGCVVAYSSFDATPPADALFGRVSGGVVHKTIHPATGSYQVLCVNPAALVAGAPSSSQEPITPYFPSGPTATGLSFFASGLTPPSVPESWITQPGRYSARCMDQGGADWLQISPGSTPGDTRPLVTQTLGPTWGLHLVDVNIDLGDLVQLAGSEASAWLAHH